MRKLLLIVASLLLSSNIFAESCISKLTYGQELNSKAYSLNMDNLDVDEDDDDPLATSIEVIRELGKMRKCSHNDINFKKTPTGVTAQSRCVEAIPGNDNTKVCYVETNIGYFFVTWDMQTTVHVIFNRWD